MQVVSNLINKLKKLAFNTVTFIICVFLGFILARMPLYSGPYLPTEEIQPDKSIVDLHVHTACLPNESNGCYLSPSLRDSYKFPLYLKAFGVTEEALQKNGSQLVVNKLARLVLESEYLSHAVILAIDAAIDDQGNIDLASTEFYVPNQYVLESIKPFPHLLFGASINPKRPDALEQLEWAKENGAVLIKWLPSIQNFDPANPDFIPFYQKLVELKLPLLSHTGHERAFSHATNEYADPMRLKLPLEQGVTVIAAHVASTGENDGEPNIARLYAMMRNHANLYSEISSLTQLNKLGYLEKALRKYGYTERLAYGSDMPLINTALVSPFYYPMQLSIEKMLDIIGTDNIFDQDIKLKQALGVPSRTFYLSKKLLRHNISEEPEEIF